jgi:hypothetical protein
MDGTPKDATPMEHEAIEELLGAYALDAVTPEEHELVRRHLEECPRCADEVALHHEVAGLLANTGQDAPGELWDRIADRLDQPAGDGWDRVAARLDHPVGPAGPTGLAGLTGPTEPTGPTGPTGPTSPVGTGSVTQPAPVGGSPDGGPTVVPLDGRRSRSRLAGRIATAVAGVAALVAVLLGVQVSNLHHQVDQLQSAAARPVLTRAATAAYDDPTSVRTSLTPVGTSATTTVATVVLTANGAGYLIADRLAPLPSTRTYQLWASIDGQLISMGLLGPDPTVVGFSVNPGVPVAAFAITEESAGGAVEATHQPVVEGTVVKA